DRTGNAIPNFITGSPYAQFFRKFRSGGPYAFLNQTGTDTNGYGLSAQWTNTEPLFDRPNHLAIGASYDGGATTFSAYTSVGGLALDRGFIGPGVVVDQADGSITPVRVAATNNYFGWFASDTLDVTSALAVTLAGRFNLAELALQDKLGASLTGSHSFDRFNPSAGATYKLLPGVSAYAGYAEANRAPTPAELSCASPQQPCSLTNFFVGDPELRQIVARTLEAGLRGSRGTLSFQLDAWRTDVSDDILFFASPIPGRGFFQNFGATRREGIEADATWRDGRWTLSAAYSFTHATFRARARLDSPDNPLADASGAILVVPGDRLPGVPEHVFKLDAQFAATKEWTLSLAARGASGVFLVGDEANLTPPTAGYIVLDAAARFRVSPGIELYAGVDNLFDRKYETFGDFSPTAAVPIAQAPGASNPRSLSPGAPRTFTAGLRWRSAD
ncbi:MAG TPA: TonB-dependent receptor, partial [Rhizomicrobium sp.]|nr:TonB-dependent receptor [Rhizomicrobium sp.]